MKMVLVLEYNVVDVNDLSFSDVMELYNIMKNSKSFYNQNFDLTCPLYPSNQKEVNGEVFIPFSMKDRAYF